MAEQLTMKELCKKYKIVRQTVYTHIKKGLPCYHIGNHVRFDEEKVHEYFEKYGRGK